MALDPIVVDKDAQDVTSSLTTGETYIFQNVSTATVEYCNHATDPTDEDVGWLVLQYGDFLTTGELASGDDPLWVRTKSLHEEARLTVVLDNA